MASRRVVTSLSDCDVVMAADPAATERYLTARTSRSAVGALATHWSGRKILIDLRADYVEVHVFIDWIFEMAERWKRYLRAVYLEANAGFKILGPIIKGEEVERGLYLNLQPFPAVGEKTARIRSDLDPEFSKSNIFVAEPFREAVLDEARAFPQGSRKDILDMLSTAVRMSRLPPSPEEREAERESDEYFAAQRRNLAGY